LIGAVVLGASSARAAVQVPDDTTRPVTTRPDTTRPDTTRRDSTAGPTTYWVAVFPAAAAPGPLAPAARHVFTEDSLRFTGALTLADLLARVPGVFIARGGFYGQAEVPFYGGRGPAGIEVFWDGMPYLPVGRDSVFLDCGRIPLSPLERVEVLRYPDRLRVDLITLRAGDTEPRTSVVVAQGDLDFTTYQAGFARRWRSGVGLSLGATANNLNGDAGTTSDFRQSDVWLKLEYVPSATLGGSYQILRSSARRAGAARVDPWESERRDGLLRAFVASRADGLGWRAEATIASSSAVGDSAVNNDHVYQTGLHLSHRSPRTALTLAGRLAYGYRPGQVEWTGGWLPLPWLTLASSARWDSHAGDRHASRVAASAGLRLPLGLSARAELVSSAILGAPRLSDDSVQRTLDWAGVVRWDSRWAEIEIARVERDPYVPAGIAAGLQPLALLGPTPATSQISVHGALRPLPGLTLSAAFTDPLRGGGDFELPRHARYAATFSSKFWRQYKSGAFALRAEVAAESWSSGLGGVARDTAGTSQLRLSGSTFVDWHLEMQIVGVTLFWQMRNATAMRNGYVPRLAFPTIIQFYGARWTFRN
jgi:hypothetical protein